MRNDIAEAMRIEPSEIADDDNLFDLGLDSIRVMDLLMRWEGTGHVTDFSRFYEASTLGEWWNIVSKAK